MQKIESQRIGQASDRGGISMIGELRCWFPVVEYYTTLTFTGADCLSAEMIKQSQGTILENSAHFWNPS